MRTPINFRKARRTGMALAMTLIMCALALAVLAAALALQATSTRLTHRAIQYDRSVAAAEAATEKVVSRMTADFLTNGNENLVINNLASYRAGVPTVADSAYWNNWVFDDGTGNLGATYVQRQPTSSYIVLGSTYAGLSALVSTYTIASHASDTASVQQVNPGVSQQVQLALIPIFQFMMYSSGDMEISCGQDFTIRGRVHCNQTLYVEPDSTMTFQSSVTAVISNLFARYPLDTRNSPGGSVTYLHPELKLSPVAALTLPIGVSNTPTAIREIIEPPPVGESASSSMGRLRYYNLCDMLVTVSNTSVTVTSGSFNGFTTTVPPAEAALFISTTNSFQDPREGKTVSPIDLNIGQLTAWSLTNSSLRNTSLGTNLTSVYVMDNRNLPGTKLGAVRVSNGKVLPACGLTVATGRPLYVWGDYNQTNSAYLLTTNTSTTSPASLVADAITILSNAWRDQNSTNVVNSRVAAATTVNAAFLTGSVDTTLGYYSGGMENFPRFLESWGTTPIWYNGSMVKMFPSLYATNAWGKANVYNPPARRWAFDVNFNDLRKLPPQTPKLLKVIRNQWVTLAPGQNPP
jgi:hypothetical protein